MSKEFSALVSTLVDRYFGPVCSQITEILLETGIATLGVIRGRIKLDFNLIKEALRSLLMHNIVSFERILNSECVGYRVNKDKALSLLRYPMFIKIIDRMGFLHRLIFEEILRAGQISLRKFLFYYGTKYVKDNPNTSLEDLKERVYQYQRMFNEIAARRYIFRSDKIDGETSSLRIPVFKPSGDGEKYNASLNLDLNALSKSILDGSPDHSLGDEDEPLWEVNIQQFYQEMRNEIILEGITRFFTPSPDSFSSRGTAEVHKSPLIDVRLPKLILDLGLKKEFDYKDSMSPLIPSDELRSALGKLPGSSSTLKYFDDHLYVLTEDSQDIFLRTPSPQGGSFNVNLHEAFTALAWGSVERIITQRHGFFAARIFRVIKIHKFLDEERIRELAMIPSKESKALTYSLVQDNFISLKEVRKSYTVASSGTSKSTFLYTIEINKVIYSLLESCYKSILNLECRLKVERSREQRLIEKEERIEKILTKMGSLDCPKEQLEEIQALITPPERALLDKLKATSEKLSSGSFSMEKTMFILESYLLFEEMEKCAKAPKAKVKKPLLG